MYCIHLDGRLGSGVPIVCIEGRLDSATSLEMELTGILRKIQPSPGSRMDCRVIIDLEKVDSVCAECFKVFQKVQSLFPVEFRKYSLFLEMQLNDHHLLPPAFSKANKDFR